MIMHVYHTTKVDMPEYFISELIQLMSGTRRTILQDIQNRVGKYDVGKYPPSLPIYRQMCEIMYYLSNNDHVFVRALRTT